MLEAVSEIKNTPARCNEADTAHWPMGYSAVGEPTQIQLDSKIQIENIESVELWVSPTSSATQSTLGRTGMCTTFEHIPA